MAFDQSPECLSLPANADLSAGQYKFVKLGTNGKVALGSVVGEPVIGVLQDKPGAVDRVAQDAVAGVSKVLAGAGGIDEGQYIKVLADGSAGVALASSGAGITGSHVVGICVKQAASGEIGAILITQTGAVPTTAG
jgi:hypothetical protein